MKVTENICVFKRSLFPFPKKCSLDKSIHFLFRLVPQLTSLCSAKKCRLTIFTINMNMHYVLWDTIVGLKQDTFSLLWHMLLFSSCILEDIFFSSTAFWIIKIPILLHSQHNSMIMWSIVRQLTRELKGGSSVPCRPMCRNNTYTCGSMAVLVAPVADMPLSAAYTKILKLSLLPTE